MPRTQVIFLVLILFVAALSVLFFWVRRKKFLSKARVHTQEALEAAGNWLKNHPELEPRYIEFDNEQNREKIFYVQTGQGPDLVLLHGIGASLYIWRFMMKELSQHYRVTALDIPGFGRSHKQVGGDYGLDAQKKRVTLFLDLLRIRRAYLVGSSMGGAIALWMAHEDPKRHPRVAALAPATSPELIPKRLSKLAAYAPFAYKTLNRSTMKIILTNVVAKRELINSDSIEAYLEPFQDQGVSLRTFFAAMELLGDSRMPRCFEGMQSQVLLLQGERDRMVTMRSIQRLIKFIPSAQLLTSPTAGHHIMEDEPEWTTTALLKFFI